MKQRSDHTTGSWWRRLDLRRRIVLVMTVTAVVVALLGWVVRTEFVVRPVLESRLAAWGDRLGGHVTFAHVRPVGWTGIQIEEVTFRPSGVDDSSPVVTIDSVEITPDRAGFVRGDLRPGHVSFRGVSADLALDLAGRADVPWLRALVDEMPRDSARGVPASTARSWPEIEVIEARGVIRDVSGVAPVVGATVERLTVVRGVDGHPVIDGAVAIDGIGRARVAGRIAGPHREVTLRMLDDNDLFALLPADRVPSRAASFSVGSVSASWPPRLTLGPVSLRQMNVEVPHNPEWRLDDIWLQQVTIEVAADGWHLHGERGRIRLAGLLAETELRLASVALSGSRAAGLEDAVVRLGDDESPLEIRSVALRDGIGVDVVASGADIAPLGRIMPAALRTRLLGGRLDGRLRFIRGGDYSTVDVDMALTGGVAHIAPLSSARLSGIDAAVASSIVMDRTHRTVDVVAFFGRIGALELDGRGSIRTLDGGHRIEVSVSVPRVDAGRALQQMPVGLFEALDGLELTGPVEGGVHAVINTADPASSRVAIDVDTDKVSVLAFGDSAPIDRVGDPDFFWWVETFEGSPRPVGPGTDDWITLADMGPLLPRAVMAAEDDAFFRHEGFDPRGVRAALQANLEARRFVRGGSTITQQVVKNLFLSHDRTLGRKLQEAILTWLTERFVEKDRILEFYVNLAHWGPGIYGIRQASLRYFRHMPRQLTLRESAFLASILPNPALFGEQYGRQVIAPSRRVKMGNILRNLQRAGLIGDADVAFHLQMIDRGVISTTPPPADLGPPGSDEDSATRPSLAQGDRLLLFP